MKNDILYKNFCTLSIHRVAISDAISAKRLAAGHTLKQNGTSCVFTVNKRSLICRICCTDFARALVLMYSIGALETETAASVTLLSPSPTPFNSHNSVLLCAANPSSNAGN